MQYKRAHSANRFNAVAHGDVEDPPHKKNSWKLLWGLTAGCDSTGCRTHTARKEFLKDGCCSASPFAVKSQLFPKAQALLEAEVMGHT
eukprot:1024966-Amphidinium_carterae.1